MFNFETLIMSVGYPAVVVVVFLEGETAMLLGGLAAKLGYLAWPMVALIGFVGAWSLDCFMFLLGRHEGEHLLMHHPRWRRWAATGERHLRRSNGWFVPLIRFTYGMRLAGPFVLGLAKYSRRRFIIIDGCSSALWAILYSGLGYGFGHAFERSIGPLKKLEVPLMLLLLSIAIFYLWWRHRQAKQLARRRVPVV